MCNYVEMTRFHSYTQFAHYKDEMYTTAQRAFAMSADRHYRLLHAAVEEKPKIIVLSVIVQEAEGLEAKDANGKCYFSAEFCLFLSHYQFIEYFIEHTNS